MNYLTLIFKFELWFVRFIRRGRDHIPGSTTEILHHVVQKLVTLNGEMALILRYFNEFGCFRGELRKNSW